MPEVFLCIMIDVFCRLPLLAEQAMHELTLTYSTCPCLSYVPICPGSLVSFGAVFVRHWLALTQYDVIGRLYCDTDDVSAFSSI